MNKRQMIGIMKRSGVDVTGMTAPRWKTKDVRDIFEVYEKEHAKAVLRCCGCGKK